MMTSLRAGTRPARDTPTSSAAALNVGRVSVCRCGATLGSTAEPPHTGC